MPRFWAKKKGGFESKHLPEVTLPDTKNRIKIRKNRRAKRLRLSLRPVCPCVPLCETGGVVAGQGSLERICLDFGRREKEGVWSKYLQGRALTKAKNVCRRKAGAELPAASLKSPQCGDFLPALVKKDWRSFACCEIEKRKDCLRNQRLC